MMTKPIKSPTIMVKLGFVLTANLRHIDVRLKFVTVDARTGRTGVHQIPNDNILTVDI